MHDRRLILALASVVACSPELDIPPAAVINCESDADCPNGMVCQVRTAFCVNRNAVDTDAPRIVAVTAIGPAVVRIDFSEEMLPQSVSAAAAYTIAGLSVSLVQVSDDRRSVRLATDLQIPEYDYGLTVDGVVDGALNPLAADSRTVIFDGFGEADETAPTPLSPTAVSLVQPTLVSFAWSPRAGATAYEVQIAADSAFENPVTRTTSASNVEVDAAALGTRQRFYWRVRSSISGWSTIATFQVLEDAVYVFCDAAQPDCDGGGTGTVNDPFTTIGLAIEAASSLGLGEVRVASRCASPSSCEVAYRELVLMRDGVSLVGGYDASFAEPPDPDTHVTIIEHDGLAVVLASGLEGSGETRLSGFSVRGVGGALADSAYGVVIDHCSAFAITDCDITAANATGTSVGVAVSNSSTPIAGALAVRVANSTIRSGPVRDRNQSVSIGLASTNSEVSIVDSSVRGTVALYDLTAAGSRNEVVGVRVNFGTIRIERAAIRSGNASTASGDVGSCDVLEGRSVALSLRNVQTAAVIGTVIESGAACESIGVRSDASRLTLSHDTIVVGGGAYGPDDGVSLYGVTVGGDGLGSGINDPTFVINTVVVAKGPATSGLEFAGLRLRSVGEALAVEHTTFAGFGTLGLIGGAAQTTTSELVTALAGLSGGSGIGTQVTSLADEAACLFGGQFRLTTASPIELRRQGKDTRQSTCGPAGNANCGPLAVDRENRARTCPTPGSDCYSRGAYELD